MKPFLLFLITSHFVFMPAYATKIRKNKLAPPSFSDELNSNYEAAKSVAKLLNLETTLKKIQDDWLKEVWGKCKDKTCYRYADDAQNSRLRKFNVEKSQSTPAGRMWIVKWLDSTNPDEKNGKIFWESNGKFQFLGNSIFEPLALLPGSSWADEDQKMFRWSLKAPSSEGQDRWQAHEVAFFYSEKTPLLFTFYENKRSAHITYPFTPVLNEDGIKCEEVNKTFIQEAPDGVSRQIDCRESFWASICDKLPKKSLEALKKLSPKILGVRLSDETSKTFYFEKPISVPCEEIISESKERVGALVKTGFIYRSFQKSPPRLNFDLNYDSEAGKPESFPMTYFIGEQKFSARDSQKDSINPVIPWEGEWGSAQFGLGLTNCEKHSCAARVFSDRGNELTASLKIQDATHALLKFQYDHCAIQFAAKQKNGLWNLNIQNAESCASLISVLPVTLQKVADIPYPLPFCYLDSITSARKAYCAKMELQNIYKAYDFERSVVYELSPETQTSANESLESLLKTCDPSLDGTSCLKHLLNQKLEKISELKTKAIQEVLKNEKRLNEPGNETEADKTIAAIEGTYQNPFHTQTNNGDEVSENDELVIKRTGKHTIEYSLLVWGYNAHSCEMGGPATFNRNRQFYGSTEALIPNDEVSKALDILLKGEQKLCQMTITYNPKSKSIDLIATSNCNRGCGQNVSIESNTFYLKKRVKTLQDQEN